MVLHFKLILQLNGVNRGNSIFIDNSSWMLFFINLSVISSCSKNSSLLHSCSSFMLSSCNLSPSLEFPPEWKSLKLFLNNMVRIHGRKHPWSLVVFGFKNYNIYILFENMINQQKHDILHMDEA